MAHDSASGDWKTAHADAATQALEHELVRSVMEEFADNMGFKLEGLPRYGLMKVAHYAAQVACAQALGFDPDLLRLSDEEAEAVMLTMARAAVAAGKPVLRIDESGATRLD
jgi:hypothetical protein